MAFLISSPPAGRWRGALSPRRRGRRCGGWWARSCGLTAVPPPPPLRGPPPHEWGGDERKPLSPMGQRLWRGGRRTGRGPGTVCSRAFAVRERVRISAPDLCAAPVGSRERSEAPVSSAGTGGADELARPGSFNPVRPLPDDSARDGRGVQKRPGPRGFAPGSPARPASVAASVPGSSAPLLRRRQAEGCTRPDPVGKNGAGNGRGVEWAGEIAGRVHN